MISKPFFNKNVIDTVGLWYKDELFNYQPDKPSESDAKIIQSKF